MDEYIEEFHYLEATTNIFEMEDQLAACYVHVLRPFTQVYLSIHLFYTLEFGVTFLLFFSL